MRCEQPGCTGQVVDGYCDLCGMAPARPAPQPSPPEPTAPHPPPPVTGAASAPADPSAATATSFTSERRSATTRKTGTGPSRLGAGLVEIPRVSFRDPAAEVMADPAVPENRRFCSHCDEPVGRSRDGAPGCKEGFCRKCGAPFSFRPKLAPGELVAGQY
jgi:serine/threonine-protein kinase PknG